jgi:hypothetical protein
MQPHLEFLLMDRDATSLPSSPENAHASAVVVFSALLLESLTRRATYMIDEASPVLRALGEPVSRRRGESPLSGFDVLPALNRLLSAAVDADVELGEIVEVFVLRDALVHNHLWVVGYAPDGSDIVVLEANLAAPHFGDAKYRGAVRDGRTVNLGLTVVPTQVNRADAAKVLAVVARAIRFLSAQPGASIELTSFMARVQDDSLGIEAVADRLRAAAGLS